MAGYLSAEDGQILTEGVPEYRTMRSGLLLYRPVTEDAEILGRGRKREWRS